MAHFLRASVLSGRLAVGVGAALSLAAVGDVRAQQLLDHVVARVNDVVLLLSDLRAAAGLGLIEPGPEPDQVRQMVQRQLLLGEVSRFPPPDPRADAVAVEVARMKVRLADPAAFLLAEGLTDEHVEALARDSLRIQAYLSQRFGSSVPVSDEAALEYYQTHQAEFTRDGVPRPFEEVQGLARERTAGARQREAVDQWLHALEGRADIVLPRR